MRFGIVAGEASGDILGAELIKAIRARHPDAVFEGIAGPRMQAAGARSLFPMDRLSVMGIVEVLGRYRELLGIRRQLANYFRSNPPDAFIGIDAPDFNLGLERQLRDAGIRTVHYVSPSVWAWRQHRIKSIARSTDLMLCLFPFEADFYRAHHVPVRFVGHPLADMIPLQVDRAAARRALALPEQGRVVALLPGSRSNELHYLAPVFIEAMQWLTARCAHLTIAVALANPQRRQQFEHALAQLPDHPPVELIDGRSHELLAAADVVLLASGTAALEALLFKRPMVVAYKLAPLTYWLASRLLKVANVSLPNLLAGETLVPELIQHEATAEQLGQALLRYLEQPGIMTNLQQRFTQIHQSLRCQASEAAADAVLDLLQAKQTQQERA